MAAPKNPSAIMPVARDYDHDQKAEPKAMQHPVSQEPPCLWAMIPGTSNILPHKEEEEKVPEEFFHHNPDPESIYRFIRPFFIAFKATGGYAITTLVYIERLLSYAEIDICPSNWKRIVLGAIILTYKYLHDEAMWNFHFFSLLRGITIKNLNELERQYICLLRFRLYVSTSVYAQYYFDLRSLASDHGLLPIALTPLRKERALNLEAISRYCENKNLCRVATKKSGSCANLTDVQRGHAILS
ncbi:cyclin-Y-like protein 1 [Myotis yumanensis]|uniref:cyclin-Y-like protein 1 n=1 Tax=Myotis yumanensis TaxID=159337 RepID=UPI0038D08107